MIAGGNYREQATPIDMNGPSTAASKIVMNLISREYKRIRKCALVPNSLKGATGVQEKSQLAKGNTN